MAAVRPDIVIVKSKPTPDFAPFSIIIDWTARINAVMGAEPHLNCGGVVHLQFLDGNENVLSEKTARFEPTAVESFDFRAGDTAGRTAVHARVTVESPCRGQSVIGNVEISDSASGETQFVIPGS